MENKITYRQRGMSVLGMLVLGVVLAGLAVVGMQVVPTVNEYYAVIRAVNKAKEGATIPEVRTLFDRQASVDSISAISGADLDISRADPDNTIVAFAYVRDIHLAGPAWLSLRYSGRSK